jgi:hypothetical protein
MVSETADSTEHLYHALRSLGDHKDLAFELGSMVVAWAYAENMLIHVLSRVSGFGLNMGQNAYYRIPTINSRMQFITSLINDWETKEFDKPSIILQIEGLARLSATRNHWVHGNWCIGGAPKETVIFDHRTKVDAPGRRKTVKAADVKNHNEAVLNRASVLRKLINADSLTV